MNTTRTPYVAPALELNSGRRKSLLQENLPLWLQPFFHEFAAVANTPRYDKLRSGESEYLRFVLQKPQATRGPGVFEREQR